MTLDIDELERVGLLFRSYWPAIIAALREGERLREENERLKASCKLLHDATIVLRNSDRKDYIARAEANRLIESAAIGLARMREGGG